MEAALGWIAQLFLLLLPLGDLDIVPDNATDAATQDQFDLRPVQRSEDDRRLKQARELLARERWNEALDVLQFLIEQPSDAFLRTETHKFVSLQDAVLDTLLQLPPAGRRAYQSRFDQPAQQLFAEAAAFQDVDGLQRLVRRYPLTPAAREACTLLSSIWEDRGAPGQAADLLLLRSRCFPNAANDASQTRLVELLVAAQRIEQARKVLQLGPDDVSPVLDAARQRWRNESPTEQLAGVFVADQRTVDGARRVDPVLLPRWSASLIERYSVQEHVDTLNAEMQERGRALVPTQQPIVVGQMVIYRTLRGLQARRVDTGELVWERRAVESPEELLTREAVPFDAALADDDAFVLPDTEASEHNPLASLLYRDDVYAALSSNGRRLFTCEAHAAGTLSAPVYSWEYNEGNAGEPDWSANELQALDVATGRLLWRVGGPAVEEQFSPPLAGHFFFGPPLPCADGLYVIAEHQGEVVLLLLDEESGAVRWEQPLSTAGHPLREEAVRRYWPCRPAYGDGVLVCSTTTGWVVAIDPVTRRLKWTTRLSPRQDDRYNYRSRYTLQSLQELNRRWSEPALVIHGGRVLVAPAELPDEYRDLEPALFCLDLLTGELMWRQDKGDALSVVGVWRDLVILQGLGSAVARSLTQRGAVVWTVPLGRSPSGKGLIAGDRLLLPLSDGTLQFIDLTKGTVLKSTSPPDGGRPLGHLLSAADRLLAVDYARIVAFPAHPQAMTPPTTPLGVARAQLRASRMSLDQGRHDDALEALERIPVLDEIRDELDQHSWTVLMQQALKPDPLTAAVTAKIVQRASTIERQRQWRRVQADRHLRRGDWRAALAGYCLLLLDAPDGEMVEEGSRQVRLDSWVAGRLLELHKTQPTVSLEKLDESLRAALPMDKDTKLMQALARAAGFLPTGQACELELARRALDSGRPSEALLRLTRAEAAAPPEQRLELQSLRENWQSRELPALKSDAARQGWGSLWSVEYAASRYGLGDFAPLAVTGPALPYFDGLRLQYEVNSERLRVESREKGQLLWNHPLRRLPNDDYHSNSISARAVGAILLVNHQGVVHALAMPERRLLWTWTLDVRGSAMNRLLDVSSSADSSLTSVSLYAARRRVKGLRSETSFMQCANHQAILLWSKDWIALDPLTGDVLWIDRDAPQHGGAEAIGESAFLAFAGGELQQRRALDGERIETETVARTLKSAIRVDLDRITLLDEMEGRRNGGWTLRQVDLAGDERWTHSLPASVRVSQVDRDTLLVLTREMEVALINLHSGTRTELGQLPEDARKLGADAAVLADRDRVFFILNEASSERSYVNMAAVRAAGTVLAFARQGGLLWRRKLPEAPAATGRFGRPNQSLNLFTQDFDSSPLLLLGGDHYAQRGELAFRWLTLLALDKETGEVAIDWKRPSDSGGFTQLRVDLAQQCVELRSHQLRVQARPQRRDVGGRDE